MPIIKVQDDEPLDRALRRFKKKLDKEGVIKQMKRQEYYEKPSQRRRRKALGPKKR